MAQAKMIWVVSGSILDVVLDIRAGSPTYGQMEQIELSAEGRSALLVPEGFAHAFLTLSDNTVVMYKASAFYSPEHERGLRWDDRLVQADWPNWLDEPLLSKRDAAWPHLDALPSDFS